MIHSTLRRKKVYGEGVKYAFSYNVNGERVTKQYKSIKSFIRGYKILFSRYEKFQKPVFVNVLNGAKRYDYNSFMKEIEGYERYTQSH